MSTVTTNQPLGTPTWIDLGVPDLDAAKAFYEALFGWRFETAPAEQGYYTTCLLPDGRRVGALSPQQEPSAVTWWNVYLATDDCDATVARAVEAGGTVDFGPDDLGDLGRMAALRDPDGSPFALWQGREHIGCGAVNEPGALLRNDLVVPDATAARAFYAAVFDFTLDANEYLPGGDFTFLRRPDGHEVGGIIADPDVRRPGWDVLFQVTSADESVERVLAAGGSVVVPAHDMPYGRLATVADPFGTELSLGQTLAP
ncbi:MAG: VOC family protein [Nocardioidaceae bacterium]|nr:VOC family protein [Nocardioidaceae bacterium]